MLGRESVRAGWIPKSAFHEEKKMETAQSEGRGVGGVARGRGREGTVTLKHLEAG
jgi:hypothetical protein